MTGISVLRIMRETHEAGHRVKQMKICALEVSIQCIQGTINS